MRVSFTATQLVYNRSMAFERELIEARLALDLIASADCAERCN